MRYNHIFFDLDHTLWDFEANALDTLREVYNLFQLETLGVIPFEQFYQRYLHHNSILWARYEKGFISSEELRWRRMWRTLMDFKIANEKLAKDISAVFLELLPKGKKVFEYTYEILDYLTEKKYSLHLITNGFDVTQKKKLESAALTPYFTHIVTSENSNSVKPKKEIFEHAVKLAGCNMDSCIMIGDNLAADIYGAQNAGMDTVFANHAKAACHLEPTYIIEHLRELHDIF